MEQINKRFRESKEGSVSDIADSIQSLADSITSIGESHRILLKVNKTLIAFLQEINARQAMENLEESSALPDQEQSKSNEQID